MILIVIISVATSGGGKKPTPAQSATPPPACASTTTSNSAANATRPATTATTVSGDGEYRVGIDIAPGTYRTDGPADSALPTCYWERDKDAKGEFTSIIANDDPTGSAVVTILPTDELFKTQCCKNWVKVG
ncbi:hypothetical protein [Streptomyces sp. NPDC014006]|uniref:hypothetical protein n=1 Tax=Streptomyces sp. NPDC014006 TaxID=3364870 RepID=UPI0036F99C0A